MSYVPDLLILGGGESGVWAAVLALRKGFNPFVLDQNLIKEDFKQILLDYSICFVEKASSLPDWDSIREVVLSPGIPTQHPWVQYFLENNIPVISELEFASRYVERPILAITGSNGKTTTTKLCHHILKHHGIQSAIGGNYGICLSHLLLTQSDVDVFTLEVSSFQLDHIRYFHPQVAVILNITPDHLDRYDYNFESYQAAKFALATNQTDKDLLVLHADLMPKIKEFQIAARVIPISEPNDNSRSLTMPSGRLVSLPEDKLMGRHNAFNIACAITAVSYFVTNLDQLESALQNFESDPHRMELVGEWNGVRFINDSKATNVDAVFYALDAIDDGPLVWIVGGEDKGNDYRILDDLVSRKVKAIICMGLDNEKILKHFGKLGIVMETCQSMSDAVNLALKHTESGDCVLLSPACASFDLFQNYVDRGNQFKNIIHSMRKN